MAFLIDDIFHAIAQKKRANESARAAKETERRQQAYWGAKETQRGARVGGANRFLQGFHGTTGQYGTGSYTPATNQGYALDPETLAAIQKPLPYAGPSAVDVSKGSGWELGGDIAQSLGNALMMAYSGGFGGLGGRGVGSGRIVPAQPPDVIPGTSYNFNQLFP